MNKAIIAVLVLFAGCAGKAGDRALSERAVIQKESDMEEEISADSAPPVIEGTVKFKYSGSSAGEVYLIGDFNNWKKEKMMKETGGVYIIEKELDTGRYQYKFVVDGNWILDPENPDSAPDGYGGQNSVLTVK